MSDVVVTDNPEKSRFEAKADDSLGGFALYRLGDGVITFVHTEVDPEFGGRGIGTAIIEQSLAEVRERGLKVVPVCPFYTKYFAEHPEVDDLL